MATARLFLAEGCRVVLWDANPQVAAVAAELGAARVCVDIAQRGSVSRAWQQTLTDVGPIDHLVHAAAVGSGKFGFPFTNLDPDDWRRVIEINILGMTYVAGCHGRRLGAASVFVIDGQ